MITIKSPDFSFVQFAKTATTCNNHLQISLDDDLAFQVMASGNTAPEIQALLSAGIALSVVNHETLTPIAALDNFEGILIADKAALFCWSGVFDLGDWKRGTCFRLMFEVDGERYYSNCFRYDTDIEETSVIRYVCDENAYGFNYCEGCENKVRVPIRLMRPQLVDDETVYVRSDGKRVVLKSITSKSYEGETEHLPFEMHEKIKIALSHDDVHVTSKNYTGGIRKDGNYEINWPTFPAYNEAKATFKVFATPYLVRNDNCKVCETYEPEAPCVPLTATMSLPDAVGGEYYYQEIPVTGSNPVLSEHSAPGWLTVLLTGNKVIVSGMGPDEGGDGVVAFRLSNDCSEVNLSSPITVTHECIDVAFVGTPSLPDGQVGENYNYEINLSGSLPIAISDIVKPSWATISLVGKKVIISGTPDSTGEAVTIGFKVTNCDEWEQAFSQNISIAPAPTNRHLEVESYGYAGATITDVCTAEIVFSRTENARADALAANQRVRVQYEVEADNNCNQYVYPVFEPGDLTLTATVDLTCASPSKPCSSIHNLECTDVQAM